MPTSAFNIPNRTLGRAGSIRQIHLTPVKKKPRRFDLLPGNHLHSRS
jgi:hypothetical protein